jgi:hypothetical protein
LLCANSGFRRTNDDVVDISPEVDDRTEGLRLAARSCQLQKW